MANIEIMDLCLPAQKSKHIQPDQPIPAMKTMALWEETDEGRVGSDSAE
jgi:hypothetical protein